MPPEVKEALEREWHAINRIAQESAYERRVAAATALAQLTLAIYGPGPHVLPMTQYQEGS